LAADVDLQLSYCGPSPDADSDRALTLGVRGVSLKAEHALGHGSNSIDVRAFSSVATTDFELAVPDELALAPPEQTLTGVGLGWSQDTRDEVYTPGRGRYLSLAVTLYPETLGASLCAQSLRANWTQYRPVFGKAVLGTRVVFEHIQGDLPFYFRPYVAFRGVPALRYAGEDVASAKTELRWTLSSSWDALVFAGVGIARANTLKVSGLRTLSAGGLGVSYRAKKYFGLTFGLDFAVGPDDTAGYVQIGNAWSK
jgi:outer membrane protein assembly factor BamA